MEASVPEIHSGLHLFRALVMEFLGTALTVYAYNYTAASYMGRGFAYFIGWILAVSISGAHFNPAVLTETLADNCFIAYWDMCLHLCQVLDDMAGWSEGCRCHPPVPRLQLTPRFRWPIKRVWSEPQEATGVPCKVCERLRWLMANGNLFLLSCLKFFGRCC